MNKCANVVCWSSGHLWRRPSKEFRLAFRSACGIGLIVHLYMFSNLLMNNDAVNYTFTTNSYLVNGRWALGFFSAFSTIYQLPVVNGAISIIMIALTSGLTVRLLKLSHPATIILTSALLTSFPATATTFAFMFTADPYFIALFMNTLAVWLTKKYCFGWLAAVALITLACGIYQAYICYAIGLFLFDCILALLEGESVAQTVLHGLKYVLIVLTSLILYALIVRLLLSYYQLSLTSYNGMEAMGSIHLGAMLSAIPDVYRDFIQRYIQWPYSSGVFRLAQIGFLFLFSGSLLYLTFVKKLYREPLRAFLGVAGVLMLPLALEFILILAYDSIIYLRMLYAFVLFFLFTVKLVEMASQQLILGNVRHWAVLPLVGLLCGCAVTWNNFCACNVGYHAMLTCYENSHALATRIIDRLERIDGYTMGCPVAFVGTPSVSSLHYGIYRNYWQPYGSVLGNEMNRNLVINANYYRYYIGSQFASASAEDIAALKANEAVASLPIWPAEGCATMIDGVAVIRLRESLDIY